MVAVTAPELVWRIEEILTAHPRLRGYTPDCSCGSPWCGGATLPAGDLEAFEELRDLRWLLGDTFELMPAAPEPAP